jgi:hypothetical protein
MKMCATCALITGSYCYSLAQKEMASAQVTDFIKLRKNKSD